ncbi:MAG TPA: hypothetical protein VIN75_13610 [Burkholderiaceae bacterium]
MSRPVASAPPAPVAWWCFPTGWLALGLPLVAVVASTLSAAIAIRGADPVIDGHRAPSRQAAEEQAEHGAQAEARLPAELARNHASMRK